MNIPGVARVAAWFRGGRPHESAQRETTLRRQLDETRAAVRAWKARAAEADTRRNERLTRRSSAGSLRVYKDEVVAARRETPSVSVVRQVFAHRLRTLSARTRDRSSSGRENDLLQVSAPYRSAIETGPDALGNIARRVELDGLTWWIPARTGAVRLPYRAILQTRDVSGGGIMLDLGANVGRMSVPRVILGDVTAAYCAEPDPMTFACLVRNVVDNRLRGLVLPDQTAISDRDGTARLLRVGASESFRLVDGTAPAVDNIVEVPCCTLDTWVDRLAIDLDAVTFIKVDVEGSERRLVAGASRVLSRAHIAWQMEVKPSGLRAAGDEPGDLYADLQHTFTHFIDLNRRAAGKRVRSIADLSESLRYIEPDGKTDVLLFSADGLV